MEMEMEMGNDIMNKNIRPASYEDRSRIAEIYVFNNRVCYFPIFKDEGYSFGKMQVIPLADNYFGDENVLKSLYVADDGIIRGFLQMDGTEISKLYVDPFFHGQGTGHGLISYAVREFHADRLWALEKNVRAIAFYERHGFRSTGEKRLEEGTDEYVIRMRREEF